MISGYDAFKISLALKLHFTQLNYDVFVNNGAVKSTEESFSKRNDKMLYVKLGSKFTDKRHLAHCIAANIAYGNTQPVYDIDKTMYNYIIWRKRKDAITKYFQDDVDKLITFDAEEIFRTPLCVETKSILHNKLSFLDSIGENPLTSSRILIIKKLHGFIQYDDKKIDKILKSRFE